MQIKINASVKWLQIATAEWLLFEMYRLAKYTCHKYLIRVPTGLEALSALSGVTQLPNSLAACMKPAILKLQNQLLIKVSGMIII